MKFDTHIFISYGHTDNIPTPEEEGWVTRFHKFHNSYLSTELGENARIWRDEKLAGNDVFSDEILKRIGSTAAAVAVVSARYTGSVWCMKEAEAFCLAAERSGGLVVGDLRGFEIERRLAEPFLEDTGRVQQMIGNDRVEHAHATFVEDAQNGLLDFVFVVPGNGFVANNVDNPDDSAGGAGDNPNFFTHHAADEIEQHHEGHQHASDPPDTSYAADDDERQQNGQHQANRVPRSTVSQ